jgi:hypothetical protein
MPTPTWKRFVAPIIVIAVLALTGWTAMARADRAAAQSAAPTPPQAAPQGTPLSVGPDVTIFDLTDIDNYTPSGGTTCPAGYGTGDCRGYSVGTNSCNVGTVPVDWCDGNSGCRVTTDSYHPVVATNTDHSVIGQALYRLKDGRFEQVGVSFLKHGFVSTNFPNSACQWNDNGTLNSSCVPPPAGGDQLGLGCTDTYGAGLNGGRPLGKRSQSNAADGDHPENPAGGEINDPYDQRVVVAEEDLDPAQNAGALYWVEGQYVVRDDARSGPTASPPAPPLKGTTETVNNWLGENGHNNASYKRVTVGSLPALNLSMVGSTVREKSAIYAWQETDSNVQIVNADRQTFFAGDPIDPPAGPGTHPDHWVVERFEAAQRVTQTISGPLQYHYEYAIHNINSDTSADGFVVDFPGSATFANVGFHDIDHHSGEPYDTSDWTIDVDGPNGKITWSAVDVGANTNALRWGTTFSFWFDSDLPPGQAAHRLDLFAIDELLPVPFGDPSAIFSDGFESGDTSGWGQAIP